MHEGDIVSQAASPCGTTVATLSLDETISLWKLFEKKKVNLSSALDMPNSQGDQPQDALITTTSGSQETEDIVRKRLERLDAQLVQKHLKREEEGKRDS